MKNTIARLTALLLCVAVAACSKTGGGQTTTTTTTAATASAVAPSCPAETSPGTADVNSWTRPHVLRYTTGEDINTLNPMLGQQGTLSYMSSLTAAWLIKWDIHNKPYPELLTEVPTMRNGGVSKDGKTITYHLRKGVKWSDGAGFNADDVVWSIHAVQNPANNVTSRLGWDYIKRVDEPDKYTVVLHMDRPYSPFVVIFFSSAGANPSVLPKHLLAQYPNINTAAFNSLPVGIGPFKYQRWDRGSRVVMVANPLYFRGMPKLKEIDFNIITDSNTAMTELQSKSLDLWYPVPGSYLAKMRSMIGGQFGCIRQPAYRYGHLDFNITRPGLSDPAVRSALRYATDRDTIIEKIGHGVGVRQDQPAPKNAPYWDPGITPVPFDIAKANQILDQAGWKRGADGVRAKNGARLSLEFVTSSGTPTNDQTIELIRTWWKQIGVQITVKHYLSALLFAPYADHGILYRGNWDVITFAWSDDPIGDFSQVYACNQIPPDGQNDLHWCSALADKAMHNLYTHYDQDQRNQDVATMQAQLDNDVPTIILNGSEDIFIFNKDLKGFHPGAVSPFDDFMNVDI